MHIFQHAHLPTLRLEGEQCLAAADQRLGLQGFEVWLRSLAPGAHTQILQHAGELVVLAQGGCGKLLIAGGPQRFQGPCTLLIPAQAPFQIVNHGTQPLQLVWVHTRAPQPCAS